MRLTKHYPTCFATAQRRTRARNAKRPSRSDHRLGRKLSECLLCDAQSNGHPADAGPPRAVRWPEGKVLEAIRQLSDTQANPNADVVGVG